MCSFRADTLLQCLPHTWQHFEPLCDWRCTLRLSVDSKVCPHTAQRTSASFECMRKAWFIKWWLEEKDLSHKWQQLSDTPEFKWDFLEAMKELWLWSVCVRLDVNLAAGLSFSLPSWTLSFWIRVCEDGVAVKGSMNRRAFVSCSAWHCSSLSPFWGGKGGFVSPCSFSFQTDEWGRYETSASLNSWTCCCCCWSAQSSWCSSLMCRGSRSLWQTLRLGSSSQCCCSGGLSSLQVDDWEKSGKKENKDFKTSALSYSYFCVLSVVDAAS